MGKRKDLLDIASLSRKEIEDILEKAKAFKDSHTRAHCRGQVLENKTVLLLFFEPSTRTRISFEISAKRLSADVVTFSTPESSVVKGETVLDTVETLAAMKVDYFIVRHQEVCIPHRVAEYTQASVVNAGDGAHAHPTQALLDAFTLKEIFGNIEGKRILIIGDILHSRVARSITDVFRKLGGEVGILGPEILVPKERMEEAQYFQDYDQALQWDPQVLYLLRIQRERQHDQLILDFDEYHHDFGITQERLHAIRDRGIWLMHPGPVNRGVELVDEAMQYEKCLIQQQVAHGIPVRMAVLDWLQPETK